jgi:hypothetical protein
MTKDPNTQWRKKSELRNPKAAPIRHWGLVIPRVFGYFSHSSFSPSHLFEDDHVGLVILAFNIQV